jgi:hypothetical protein
LKKYLVSALCLVLGALAFAGCDWDSDDPHNNEGTLPASFIGEWHSRYDGYTITAATLAYDDGSNGVWGFSFASTIVYVSNFNSTSGVIIVQYTSPPPAGSTGNFQGIYYQILSANEVRFANAYDPEGTTEAPDLAAAVAKFTQSNAETFVTWGIVVPQTKQ